jgi:hypothetical protein
MRITNRNSTANIAYLYCLRNIRRTTGSGSVAKPGLISDDVTI